MPRILFSKDFDFRVSKHCIRAYKAGKEYLVSQEAAKQAVEKGAGKQLPSVNRRGRNAGR